jgi:aspartyl aminopeptidase
MPVDGNVTAMCATQYNQHSRKTTLGIYYFALVIFSLIVNAATGLASLQPRLPPLVRPSSSSSMDQSISQDNVLELAHKAMSYLDSSTDPFHAVQSSIDILKTVGFIELLADEDKPSLAELVGNTNIQPGGKYYYTRNRSTLVAFAVGGQCGPMSQSPHCGIKIIGGHTDSPNLRIKPRSQQSTTVGCIQLGVECYGGGLWHTWFDRDLGISGRVLMKKQEPPLSSSPHNETDRPPPTKIVQRLVKIDRALLRISNLAIHLQTDEERKAFKYNKEDHLSPILAMEVENALTGTTDTTGGTNALKSKDGWTEYQEPALLHVLANELGVNVSDIVDFELNLFDVQKAALGGAYSEFVYSARLDNLASCFLAVQALVDHVESGTIETDSDVSMIVLYDHEEVGSNSAVGAASPILNEAVRRISSALSAATDSASLDAAHTNCIQRSFVLSCDQAHAVHPNYVSKHEKNHQPRMNQGMVIKRNSNQRYATNPITGLLIREVARRAGLAPVQEFIVRQDCGCGSTIGPVISAATGIRTIDMGCPQLSMHSIREIMGIRDLTNGLGLFKAFFKHFREVDSSVEQ